MESRGAWDPGDALESCTLEILWGYSGSWADSRTEFSGWWYSGVSSEQRMMGGVAQGLLGTEDDGRTGLGVYSENC